MPKPYSPDLRERVIKAVEEEGLTRWQAAERFRVGSATVYRWTRRMRLKGSVEPSAMGGSRSDILGDTGREELKRLVEEAPDRTRDELQDGLEKSLGIKVSVATIGRALQKLGFTRKKKTLVASERDTERVMLLRKAFHTWQQDVDFTKLVFVDETGSNAGMTPKYARALRGHRVADFAPRNKRKNVTIIAALSICGLECAMTIEGGTNTAVFAAFIEKVLGPRLQKGDLVVLDNVGAHKPDRIAELVDSFGAKLVFLPPYSPELNPIEECFSKLKNLLRKAKARTRAALDRAVAAAMKAVTVEDAVGWFGHAGYPVQPV